MIATSSDETSDLPGPDEPPRSGDVRLRGFNHRVSVDQATRWLDAQAQPLPDEDIDLADGLGRITAVPILTPRDFPAWDRAVENGYAVRAGDTAGASDYNPLSLAIEASGLVLPAGAAALIVTGAALPRGADAVLPFGAVQSNGVVLDAFDAIAQGRGVERRAQHARAGAVLLEPGRRLRAQDIGLLASLGLSRLRAVRQPRVKLIIAGPKPSVAGQRYDADGPMLQALIARDGGTVSNVAEGVARREEMKRALAGPPADAILLVGRTGTGPDDEAPLALAEAGTLAIHGIALRPGGSAGMGLIGGVPVVLLPGDPMACLSAYEIFAGRLIRRLGGHDPDLPHPMRDSEVGRKIVSTVGSLDLCQVRFVDDRVEPVGPAEFGGLPSAVRADGFVLVPASLEGYAPGARVFVRLYPKNRNILYDES